MYYNYDLTLSTVRTRRYSEPVSLQTEVLFVPYVHSLAGLQSARVRQRSRLPARKEKPNQTRRCGRRRPPVHRGKEKIFSEHGVVCSRVGGHCITFQQPFLTALLVHCCCCQHRSSLQLRPDRASDFGDKLRLRCRCNTIIFDTPQKGHTRQNRRRRHEDPKKVRYEIERYFTGEVTGLLRFGHVFAPRENIPGDASKIHRRKLKYGNEVVTTITTN